MKLNFNLPFKIPFKIPIKIPLKAPEIHTFNIRMDGFHVYNGKYEILIDESDEAIFVSQLVIDVPLQAQGSSYYFACKGVYEIIDDVIYITNPKTVLTYKRHLMKTLTWRAVGTVDTMVLAWIITGNPITGLKIGGMEIITKMILYFFHERAWYIYGKR